MGALKDAAGRIIATDKCPTCERPKIHAMTACCSGCISNRHSSACNIRCAAMGVPGFGVRADYMDGKAVRVIQ
jgi:hypothetical protein